MKDALLAEYDHEIATTRKLLERLPDDKLTWKPHVKSMSLGGLGTHLANLPLWAGTILNDTRFDLARLPPNLAEKTSRADILAAFDESTKRARGWMDKTDAELLARWTLLARRAGDLLDAAHRRVPQLRAESSDSSSRPVERLPAPERHPGAADLRTVGGRGVTAAADRLPPLNVRHHHGLDRRRPAPAAPSRIAPGALQIERAVPRAITIVATALPIRFVIARASDMKRSTPRSSVRPATGNGRKRRQRRGQRDESAAGDRRGALRRQQQHARIPSSCASDRCTPLACATNIAAIVM